MAATSVNIKNTESSRSYRVASGYYSDPAFRAGRSLEIFPLFAQHAGRAKPAGSEPVRFERWIVKGPYQS